MIRGLYKSIRRVSLSVLLGGALLFGAPPAVAKHIKEDDGTSSKTRLLFPIMNPERGRILFLRKGCVSCHSINDTGGDVGPALDAPAGNRIMNPFSFAANMWNHAPAMIAAQEDKLGEQVHFTGEELGNIIAFIHDIDVQKKFGTPDASKRDILAVSRLRLIMPIMNPDRGRSVFVNKGCVTCHAVNGIGGDDAPALDAHAKEMLVNPFAFAAKMWDHAPGMIAAQEEELGEQLVFTGQELADITAFMHDAHAQRDFERSDLTPRIRKMMSKMGGHGEDDDDGHEEEAPKADKD